MSIQIGESPLIKSYRELLGLGTEYSKEDLKKAYHQMAFLYHPDRNPDPAAREEFVKVKRAFEILNDVDAVRKLNADYIHDKLFRKCVDDLNLSFGSLFGYRIFRIPKTRIQRALRLGREVATETDGTDLNFDDLVGEEGGSILDNPAFDAIELVYAGKFSIADEERLQGGFSNQGVVQLPWVVLNNQGIMYFLNGQYRKAHKAYEQLNSRIPNNIIFMYRLAVCKIIIGFTEKERGFLTGLKPNRTFIVPAIDLLKHCIQIGDERTVGRQDCLLIKKVLAEVLSKTGSSRSALKLWREVLEKEPDSTEALFYVRGATRALENLKRLTARKRKADVEARKAAAANTPLQLTTSKKK